MPAAAAARSRTTTTPAATPPESSTWYQLKALLGDQRREVAVLSVASVLTGFAESGILAILAQTASALVDGVSRVHIKFGPLHLNGKLGVLFAIGFALAVLRLGLQGVLSVIPARMVAHIQGRLRRQVFGAFTRASWEEQARDREGHLQELLTNQVAQATQSVVQAATLIMVSLAFVVLVISALALNVVAALLVLVAAAVLSAGLRPLGKLGGRWSREFSRTSLQFAAGINEAVRVAEETHVFGAEEAQREQAAALQAEVQLPFYKANMLARLVPGIYQSLIYLLVMAALAGLYFLGSGKVTALGAVVLLLVRAGAYGQQGQAAFQTLRQSLPFIERLAQAQERYVASRPKSGEKPLEHLHVVSFTDVSFAYEPDRPVLSHINFEVAGGETIGVIGPSGAGKSTVVQILLGLRAPASGQYLVNGVPADTFSRGDWHARVAYVPQEPRLLHASVADNIRFFRPIDDAAIERAARLAGIHDDVMTWSAGYGTIIGPRADAVSGGQQQRVCLARALADEPQLLVLDEPTSALDPNAEALIQRSLLSLKGNLTLFVVAHRMSTLDICERVMVIVDGGLESFARLPDLQQKSAYYRSAGGGRFTARNGDDGSSENGLDRGAAPVAGASDGLLASVRNRFGGAR